MAKEQLKAALLIVAVLLAGGSNLAAASSQMATLEDLSVDGVVDGDVITIAGNIELGPNAHVQGHVVAVHGSIEAAPGARVDGRTIAIRSLATMTLEPAGAEEIPFLQLAVALLTSGGWLLVTTVLAFLFPVRLRYGTWVLPRLGWRLVLIGLLAIVTVVAALLAVLGLGPALGVPLAAALGLVFLASRALGLTVLGGYLGSWLLQRWLHHPLPLTVPVFLGVSLLLAARFLPLVGGPVWNLVSVTSIGCGVFTLAMAPTGEAVSVPLRPTGSARG